jgi:hypothetical protein
MILNKIEANQMELKLNKTNQMKTNWNQTESKKTNETNQIE